MVYRWGVGQRERPQWRTELAELGAGLREVCIDSPNPCSSTKAGRPGVGAAGPTYAVCTWPKPGTCSGTRRIAAIMACAAGSSISAASAGKKSG